MNLFKKKSKLYAAYEKLQRYVIVFVLTPSFFILEMTIVRPKIVEVFKMGLTKELFHVVLSTFCFINVVGNMIMTILIDTKVKGFIKEGTYCHKCCLNMPEKAWHCSICDVCILKRDHHCSFFSKCIGQYNLRFYLLYIFYINISMIYSSYFNYFYVSMMYDNGEMIISAFKIFNPFLRLVLPGQMELKDLYLLFLFLNIGLLFWSSFLLCFHMRNALRGVTARESSKLNSLYPLQWRKNLLQVFGSRWYLAIFWPLSTSPIPSSVKEE